MLLHYGRAARIASARWLGVGACLLTSLTSVPVTAQPNLLSPAQLAQRNAPVSQTELNSQIAYFKQEKLLQARISLSGTDASLEEVARQVEKLLPNLKKIEIRDANNVRLTFALTSVSAKSLLQSVATLAGCEYLHLSDGIVLSPRSKTTVDERQEDSLLSSRVSGTRQLLAKTVDIIAELKQRPDGKAALSDLSPEYRQILMALVAGVQAPNSPNPHPDSIVMPSPPGETSSLLISLPAERHQYCFAFKPIQQ